MASGEVVAGLHGDARRAPAPAEHPDRGLLAHRQAVLPAALRPDRRRLRDVGIWHETFRVRTSDIETIYGDTPPLGLGAAPGTVPLQRGRDSAAVRIGARQTDDPALPAC